MANLDGKPLKYLYFCIDLSTLINVVGMELLKYHKNTKQVLLA